jgi:hypothetical protein
MTEAEWMAGRNILKMLGCFFEHSTHRKNALFACACSRQVWNVMPRFCREALLAVERYLEGQAAEEELVDSFAGFQPRSVDSEMTGSLQAVNAIEYLGWRWSWGWRNQRPNPESYLHRPCMQPYETSQVARSVAESLAKSIPWDTARKSQIPLLYELMGNPYRPVEPCTLDVMAWNGGTVPKVAETIYRDRDFESMPILADALEDAGYTDSTILEHLRLSTTHQLGCWALDYLLGKK